MVSKAIDLRLVPLNAERAFVAKMLVRAALEIGACILLAPFQCSAVKRESLTQTLHQQAKMKERSWALTQRKMMQKMRTT